MIKHLIATAAIFAAPALAAPAADAPVALVTVADLDLANAAGRTTFQHRVERAADRLCGSADSRDLARSAEVRTCREAVRSSARTGMETAMARKAPQNVLATNLASPPVGGR